MLIRLFPKLGDNKIIRYVKTVLGSKHSAILIAALTLISNLFGLEIPVLYTLALIVAFASLFCDDLLCLVPLACCGYFTFSKENNPLSPYYDSFFNTLPGAVNLILVAAITAIPLLTRVIHDAITIKERQRVPKYLLSYLLLGVTYILGGLFSDGFKTSFFGLAEIAALSFSYFVFYFTVDFKKVEKSYFAYMMTVIGVLLCLEVLGMLYYGGYFSSKRSSLYTGWGVNNNVAGALIMCVPAPFYYAAKKKHGWPYILLASVFFFFLALTQSRGGIFFGACVYAASVIFMFITAKKRVPLAIALLLLGLLAIFFVFYFNEQFVNMFASVLLKGFDDNGRFKIYLNGWQQFLERPFFGNGFYACDGPLAFNSKIKSFLPPRYHSTIIQILASCGIFGLAAYSFHRIQTLLMVFTKRSAEKYFIGLCAVGLLATSLLDCHLFNFGPGFTYSALLLFLEIEDLREPPPPIYYELTVRKVITFKASSNSSLYCSVMRGNK